MGPSGPVGRRPLQSCVSGSGWRRARARRARTSGWISDFGGPLSDAAAAGLPYLKGGICEVGAGVTLLQEAQIYATLPNSFGVQHKQQMRSLALRKHLAAIQLVGSGKAGHDRQERGRNATYRVAALV